MFFLRVRYTGDVFGWHHILHNLSLSITKVKGLKCNLCDTVSRYRAQGYDRAYKKITFVNVDSEIYKIRIKKFCY